ncbi:LacI family DNA-binding transcriptional regulator [Victivallis sp. Marseille-Q1083]|uniref:LacI family DNA-binding transcriptional regulator n=1 Tax=Victivallis sp. Marseille-Q1083 TaxID=2717288 RepID=UPI001588555A|nr:LacI family DNA-binding transcriptional regulator [Victivallis sp. Marseille-Q1083]
MSTAPERKNGKLRISDIARLAGVSTAAVSAVLNNRPKISAQTKERVQQIIKTHNYVPQSAARMLSSKRSYQIGFLLSCKVTLGLANNYFATMLSGVHDICRKRKYNVVISTYDMSDINEFIMPTNIRQCNIDGLILAGITDLQVVREIQKTKLPFVIIGGQYPEDILCVNTDEQESCERILSYFYSLGHRRIAVPVYYLFTREIYQEARERLCAKNLWNDLELQFPPYQAEEFISGARLAGEWLAMPLAERFTALAATDQFAAGFLNRFIEAGGNCPQDISIISLETPLSRYGIIQMTTFDDHTFILGQQAALSVLDLAEGKRTFEEISFNLNMFKNNAEIIVRHSTAPPPNRSLHVIQKPDLQVKAAVEAIQVADGTFALS